MAQGSARSTSVVLTTGFWQTQSGPATTAPGNGKYNADNWATPTLIAISSIDNDGYDRHAGLLSLRSGDQIMELATNNSQNFQEWSVTSVTDQGTWVQIGVTVVGAGSTFVTPGMNQTRIIQALQIIAQEEPSGPTFGPKPNLATEDNIVDRLGRNLNQIEAARVTAMLADGSAIIRRYARNDFMFKNEDYIEIVADSGRIVLPGRPIYSVDAVTWKSGLASIPDIPVIWFIFDGVDTITIPEPRDSSIINLPAMWYSVGFYSSTFGITHTHGYQVVPDDIVGLLCSAIISELSTPTMSATLQSEAIGAYSYSMRRRALGGGLYAALLDFGMQDLLQDYRRKRGTIAMRF